MYLAQPTQGPRIVPKGKARTSADVLPNGRPGFRVTLGFYDFSAAPVLGGQLHRAIDFGNFYTGDALYAAHPGRLINKRDSSGALVVEVTRSDGWVTSYAHLSRFAQTSGIMVPAGRLIGWVGNTGLSLAAHCHMGLRSPSGEYFDPWIRLLQNRPTRLNGAGINIRNRPNLRASIFATSRPTGIYTPKGIRVAALDAAFPSGWDWVRGGNHGILPHIYQWRKLWINGAYRYVARPLVTIL